MPLFGSAKDLDVRSNNKCSGKDVKKLQKTIQDRFDLTVRTSLCDFFRFNYDRMMQSSVVRALIPALHAQDDELAALLRPKAEVVTMKLASRTLIYLDARRSTITAARCVTVS